MIHYTSGYGGGAYNATLYNCALIANAAFVGGGECTGNLYNCAVNGNSATSLGGGTFSAYMYNCIVYYNVAPSGANYASPTRVYYCCTLPAPANSASSTNNFETEPQLAGAFHLSAGSPCRSAGSASYASGTDIDGETWATPPAIGCDGQNTGSTTGALSASIQMAFTNIAPGFALDLTAWIDGRLTASRWEFDDGLVVSNRPYASRAWNATGDYPVVLRAYNDSNPSGITATAIVHVVTQPVRYVALNSPSPQAPYDSWATAAANIQDAVDSAIVPGALVWVSNGVYATGGRVVAGALTNRLAVTCPVVVQSVNGPGVTVIQGNQVSGTTNGNSAARCVYLTNGAALIGFTLTNGATRASGDAYVEESGGGVWCPWVSAIVSNCVLTGNSAYMYGGGAYNGTLNNCTIAGNFSRAYGGGISTAALTNCTLAGNTAGNGGGGAHNGLLSKSILASNTASSSGGGAYGGTLTGSTLMANSAASGGGAYQATLSGCMLTSNTGSSGKFSSESRCAIFQG